jgi:hypothetical protein
MSLVISTLISIDEGGRQVKEGFLSLETTEPWIVHVYHSEGGWTRQKI